MGVQLHHQPLLEDFSVNTELIIGPESKKPLRFAIPLIIYDMSFGPLSEAEKVAMATGPKH